MSSVKIKKLTLQYSYLLLEDQEVYEYCLQADKEIKERMKEKYPQDYDRMYETPVVNKSETPAEKQELNEDIETSEELEIEQKIIKNKDVKKLYRKIAEKTHPDKVGNDVLSSVFSEASEAYQNNDIAALLNLAGSLNIELLELSEESLRILESNVVSLSQKINTRKSTTSWAYHNAKTQEEKDKVITLIINHLRSQIR